MRDGRNVSKISWSCCAAITFREAPSGIEIWTRSQDPSYASWSDPTTDVKGNLLFEDGLSRVEEYSIRALRLDPVRQRSCLANGSGGLATLDDGSTRQLVDEMQVCTIPDQWWK
jgi:hypothetical protein